MLFLEYFGEPFVPFKVLRPPLFVSHSQQFHSEWLRMSQRRPLRTPRRRRRAIGKFHQIERILDVRLQFIHGDQLARVELTCHSAIENRQRFGANVFRKLEELEEAQAKRLEVVGRRTMRKFVIPTVDKESPISPIADRRLPLITTRQ